ncbi:MAG: acyl-CoA desaturase [Deltaproteobacteria bacterium]|nr:MAG: acyl-CoA desaturase [Deltaproteobacteria bacterium]TMQ14096.1 MAG: acyl-CoA desaturase [Deltaproteobacteria bacterium]
MLGEEAMPAGERSSATGDRLYLRNVIYFGALHALPLGALITGASRGAFVAAAVLYVVRIWFVTCGYHSYFSHRAFKTSRWFQLVLAIGAQTSSQGSVLGWAATHRYHHVHADAPSDLHSPHHRGLWYAHIGWLLRTEYLARSQPRTGPFAAFPELVWLDRHPYVPPVCLATALALGLGWPGLFIGYGLSTLAVYHATFAVNSLAHRFGARPYATPDGSRNNWLVALIMLGGGWHNNHHRFPRSARHGLRWWELDVSYGVLVVLGWLALVSEIRVPRPESLSEHAVRRTPERSHRPC